MNQIEKDLNALIVTLKDEKIISTKNISDKWHTFQDLYDHRMAFNIALCHAIRQIHIYERAAHFEECVTGEDFRAETYCYKSWKHYDNDNDPMFEGSFIVVIESPAGQISYHYKAEHWDKFKISERIEANLYDGHTPEDTMIRLKELF